MHGETFHPWKSPTRAVAVIALMVLIMVALRLQDQPNYMEPIYLNTAISLIRDGDFYHLREDLILRERRVLKDFSHVTVTGHDPVPTAIVRGFFAGICL